MTYHRDEAAPPKSKRSTADPGVVVHEVVHYADRVTVPTLPVTERQLGRHVALYGEELTEGVKVEGAQQVRPLPSDWPQRRRRCFHRDHYRCQLCQRKQTPQRLRAFHITPREDGGTDHLPNLITLCAVATRKRDGLSCHDWVAASRTKEQLARTAAAIRAAADSHGSRVAREEP